jgi:hypothetical protein
LAIQWLNETLFLVASSLVADSFVLLNRELLLAANLPLMKKNKIFENHLNEKSL